MLQILLIDPSPFSLQQRREGANDIGSQLLVPTKQLCTRRLCYLSRREKKKSTDQINQPCNHLSDHVRYQTLLLLLLPSCLLPFDILPCNRLEIITRDQTSPARLSRDLCLPPPVVLQPQDGQDVALGETELLGNGGAVQVHCSC